MAQGARAPATVAAPPLSDNGADSVADGDTASQSPGPQLLDSSSDSDSDEEPPPPPPPDAAAVLRKQQEYQQRRLRQPPALPGVMQRPRAGRSPAPGAFFTGAAVGACAGGGQSATSAGSGIAQAGGKLAHGTGSTRAQQKRRRASLALEGGGLIAESDRAYNTWPFMTGWMAKKGRKRQNWNQRWFVLVGPFLLYYEKPEDQVTHELIADSVLFLKDCEWVLGCLLSISGSLCLYLLVPGRLPYYYRRAGGEMRHDPVV